jgi:hypothetical protein
MASKMLQEAHKEAVILKEHLTELEREADNSHVNAYSEKALNSLVEKKRRGPSVS